MSISNDTAFKVGDLVTVAPDMDERFAGTVWRVAKVPTGPRGINYKLDNVTKPGARGLTAPAYALLPAPEGAHVTAVDTSYTPPPQMGMIVACSAPLSGQSADLLYVVTKPGEDKTVVVRLGGDAGRYWRLANRYLTQVPLTDLTERLPAHLRAI